MPHILQMLTWCLSWSHVWFSYIHITYKLIYANQIIYIFGRFFSFSANCVAAALGLLKPCRLQRRKNPRRWCTFVSEMSLGRETFLWVWQSALGRSQTGFWTNMIRKFIHQFSGHFLTWALKNIACTMEIAHWLVSSIF